MGCFARKQNIHSPVNTNTNVGHKNLVACGKKLKNYKMQIHFLTVGGAFLKKQKYSGMKIMQFLFLTLDCHREVSKSNSICMFSNMSVL